MGGSARGEAVSTPSNNVKKGPGGYAVFSLKTPRTAVESQNRPRAIIWVRGPSEILSLNDAAIKSYNNTGRKFYKVGVLPCPSSKKHVYPGQGVIAPFTAPPPPPLSTVLIHRSQFASHSYEMT